MITMVKFILALYFTHLAQSAGPSDGLRGLHFRASASNIRPTLMIARDASGNYSYSGILKEMCDWMFNQKSNSSYEFVPVDPKEVATLGIYQSAIKLLIEGEADIVTLGLVPSLEKTTIMDFCSPSFIAPFQFLLPTPGEESRLLGPFKPFHLSVWVIFVTTVLIFILTLSVTTKYRLNSSGDRRTRKKNFADHFSDNFVYVITIIIGNGEYIPGRTLGLRILVAVWCLMCVILINAYTGNLTSYLTIPTYKPIPNSFEELAARKDLQLIAEERSLLTEDILSATSGPFKILGDFLRYNPQAIFRTQAEGLAKFASSRNSVAVGVSTITYVVISHDLKVNGKCRLTLSKPLQRFLMFSWALAKGNPHHRAMDIKLQYLWETGLLNYWMQKYSPNIDRCLKIERRPARNTPLKFADLSSAFVLLGIGIGISMIALFLEIMHKRLFVSK